LQLKFSIFFEPCRGANNKALKRFREIAAFPSNFADFPEYDSTGRRLGVHVFGKFAIKFWGDQADRHVKILDLHLADRSR
jgi:hypothetical protein